MPVIFANFEKVSAYCLRGGIHGRLKILGSGFAGLGRIFFLTGFFVVLNKKAPEDYFGYFMIGNERGRINLAWRRDRVFWFGENVACVGW